MPALPQSNIHLDILMGRDECIEPVDIFGGAYTLINLALSLADICCSDPESGPPLDIHRDMERKLRI
jgi:proteasome maturation protein